MMVQASPGRLGPVATIARVHPRLTIVIDHLGLIRWTGRGSEGLSGLLGLATHPNICVKLSGLEVLSGERYPFRAAWPLARAVVDAFGPDRVMWGSNSPRALSSTSYEELARGASLCLPGVPDADLRLIICGTAVRIWGE
jgi:L-fuconolactonase